MKQVDETFAYKRINVTGNEYLGCKVLDCVVVFDDSAGVGFNECTFDGCSWAFGGAAAQTIRLLRALDSDFGREFSIGFIFGD